MDFTYSIMQTCGIMVHLVTNNSPDLLYSSPLAVVKIDLFLQLNNHKRIMLLICVQMSHK